MEITINELAIIPEIVKSAVMNGGENSFNAKNANRFLKFLRD